MLVPSDFRKNFSYLLDLYSDEQYALKNLIEFRLPTTFGVEQVRQLHAFANGGETDQLSEPLYGLFAALGQECSTHVRKLLRVFLDYARSSPRRFDFRDCALGNLIFAGAYLSHGHNFNGAAEMMSRLVSSQAILANVSNGENRILAALKENGELLAHEMEIVGEQSPAQIRKIFFMPDQLSEEEMARVNALNVSEKEAWLSAHHAPPSLSEEARRFIRDADIIIYGPGTQHSSLLPSYAIAARALQSARAPVKALVMNLGPDHDIQGLSASDLVDRALMSADDPDNGMRTITHILLNDCTLTDGCRRLAGGMLTSRPSYKRAAIVRGHFENATLPQIHNGRAVVSTIINIWDRNGATEEKPSLEIFYDPYPRPAAGSSLIEEFLELDWDERFRRVVLRVRGEMPKPRCLPNLAIEDWECEGAFPEVAAVANWLRAGGSDYMATITGDGEYRLRDIVFGIKVLEQGSFGSVFGSRTQSRRQFNFSLRAAYGERGIAYHLSLAGAFVLSMLFAMRFGIIFSDPLTGFRIYRRSKLEALENLLRESPRVTPSTITKLLIRSRIEITELPVQYRTFAGFTDPRARMRRGFLNLLGVLS
jgi:hypothetical protein